mgnify:CR=1 FL=1|tara:strand:- start:14 stop:187 length:174 start_codon:yes stop_codon:yes gene_type:complete
MSEKLEEIEELIGKVYTNSLPNEVSINTEKGGNLINLVIAKTLIAILAMMEEEMGSD